MFRKRKKPKRYVWSDDSFFCSLMQEISNFTLIDTIRCFVIYQFVKYAAGLTGDIAEVGVYKGGSARLLARTCPSKKIHLFDTFTGMPPVDPIKDLHKEGDFYDTSLKDVKEYLKDCGNISFYQGTFPTTAQNVRGLKFCFVHIDVDIYKSVWECCRFFYDVMTPKGLIIIDDYGFASCLGAKQAIDDFFLDKPEQPILLPTGQCFIIKN